MLTDSPDPPARVEHVDSDVVVIDARCFGVDAGEAAPPSALLVRQVHAGTLAAVAAIVVSRGVGWGGGTAGHKK